MNKNIFAYSCSFIVSLKETIKRFIESSGKFLLFVAKINMVLNINGINSLAAH
jgi:subtilase family serine protease